MRMLAIVNALDDYERRRDPGSPVSQIRQLRDAIKRSNANVIDALYDRDALSSPARSTAQIARVPLYQFDLGMRDKGPAWRAFEENGSWSTTSSGRGWLSQNCLTELSKPTRTSSTGGAMRFGEHCVQAAHKHRVVQVYNSSRA